MKNPNAVALGKLAKGRPKKFSQEELAKRTARLPHARVAFRSEIDRAEKEQDAEKWLEKRLSRKGKKK